MNVFKEYIKRHLGNKKQYIPLDEELRKYFEKNIQCLIEDFQEPLLEIRKVLTPTPVDFPIKWDNSESNAIEVIKILSKQLVINIEDIELFFFNEGIEELTTGIYGMALETEYENSSTSESNFAKNDKGKYEIKVNINTLKDPNILVANIAYELTQIKLYGEKKIHYIDGVFAELAAIIFGFGVFNANASFNFIKQNSGWNYIRTGFLNFDEWAYALAFFAFLRKELDPDWSNYLNPTIKNEFVKCLKYIADKENIMK